MIRAFRPIRAAAAAGVAFALLAPALPAVVSAPAALQPAFAAADQMDYGAAFVAVDAQTLLAQNGGQDAVLGYAGLVQLNNLDNLLPMMGAGNQGLAAIIDSPDSVWQGMFLTLDRRAAIVAACAASPDVSYDQQDQVIEALLADGSEAAVPDAIEQLLDARTGSGLGYAGCAVASAMDYIAAVEQDLSAYALANTTATMAAGHTVSSLVLSNPDRCLVLLPGADDADHIDEETLIYPQDGCFVAYPVVGADGTTQVRCSWITGRAYDLLASCAYLFSSQIDLVSQTDLGLAAQTAYGWDTAASPVQEDPNNYAVWQTLQAMNGMSGQFGADFVERFAPSLLETMGYAELKQVSALLGSPDTAVVMTLPDVRSYVGGRLGSELDYVGEEAINTALAVKPAGLLLAALSQGPAFEQLGYIDKSDLELLNVIALRSAALRGGVPTQMPMPQGWTQDLAVVVSSQDSAYVMLALFCARYDGTLEMATYVVNSYSGGDHLSVQSQLLSEGFQAGSPYGQFLGLNGVCAGEVVGAGAMQPEAGSDAAAGMSGIWFPNPDQGVLLYDDNGACDFFASACTASDDVVLPGDDRLERIGKFPWYYPLDDFLAALMDAGHNQGDPWNLLCFVPGYASLMEWVYSGGTAGPSDDTYYRVLNALGPAADMVSWDVQGAAWLEPYQLSGILGYEIPLYEQGVALRIGFTAYSEGTEHHGYLDLFGYTFDGANWYFVMPNSHYDDTYGMFW